MLIDLLASRKEYILRLLSLCQKPFSWSKSLQGTQYHLIINARKNNLGTNSG